MVKKSVTGHSPAKPAVQPQRARSSMQQLKPSPATLPHEIRAKELTAQADIVESKPDIDLNELGYDDDFVRKPFGKQSQKLDFTQREGFHRHWFNDTPGRVELALGAGYRHVKDDKGKNKSAVVGTTTAGDAMRGYLMEIPQDWYEADMKSQQDPLEEFDRALQQGHDGHTTPGIDGSVVPREFTPSQTPMWTQEMHTAEKSGE